jgi:hypothetical protein
MIASDQQKGGTITFDAAAHLLRWGEADPIKMIVTSESNDPLEITAKNQDARRMMIGLRIPADHGAIKFTANAEDSLFIGTCERR